MYSSVNNHDTSTSILSLKELFAVIIVFAFVLYLLFPKGNIESLLNGKEENTNLSINYLQSMLLYHPENQKLKMMLIKKYDYAGKIDEALALNEALIKSTHDKALLIELYKTNYLLHKTNYFKTGDKKFLTALKKELLDYFNFTKGEQDTLFFYAESTNIDYAYIKYHSLTSLMEEQPEVIDYELEKIRYYLADRLNYKEDAYAQLIRLLNYPEIETQLQEYALNSLIAHKEYDKAANITTKLMLNAYDNAEITKYFYLALYALSQNKEREKGAIATLIGSYIGVKEIDNSDIYTIINTLLQHNSLKEASYFATKLFQQIPEQFNEKTLTLAQNALTYNSQLEDALEISSYAYHKFHKQKYLDKTIQLSLWAGKVAEATALNIEGYTQYGEKKYEQYLLKHTSLDEGYEILGKIYKNKVTQGNYKFVKNLSEYFHYTGEIDKAEAFFTQQLIKTPQKELHAATVNFSFDNSHFEKAFTLYEAYKASYGLNVQLQNKTIKRLIANKQFKKAYLLTQELKQQKKLKEQRLLVDLSWYHKDYHYLHQTLWGFEKIAQLNTTGYERLIFLERGLKKGEKLSYLYQKAWQQTKRSDYLLALLYNLFENKKFQAFNSVLKRMKPHQKAKFETDINYNTLLANYYIETSQRSLALNYFHKALALAPKKVTTHQAYLWFLLDNYKQNPALKKEILAELALLKNSRELQESIGIPSIVAAMVVKNEQLARRWNRSLIKLNPLNKEYKILYQELELAQQTKLYERYDKMLNNQPLNGEVSVKKRYLSATQEMSQSSFSYQWKPTKNIKSTLTLNHYEYQDKGKATKTDTSLAFALKNEQARFLWDVTIEPHQAKNNYLSASLNLGYHISSFNINVESKYQNKTQLTPQLEQEGLEDSLAISLNDALSRRISLGFLFKKSQFKKQSGFALGKAQTIQLSANYILRLGYPDIRFDTYLNNNQFTQDLAHNFSEFGISTSVGTSRQYTLNQTWKPFASLGFAINDQKNIGSSLSMGVSKTIQGKDSLDFLLNYSDGIGVISEPIYGLEVKYRF